MLRLLIQRFLQTGVVVIIVSLIVFTLMRFIPGDPVSIMFGEELVSGEQKDAARRALGLDQPIPVQYLHFLAAALRGDLGNSLFRDVPVMELIIPALMATIELTLASIIVAVVFGAPIAIISALKQGTAIDRGGSAVALFGISMPSFWLGILLVMVFSVQLGMLPTGGRTSIDVPSVTGLVAIDSLLAGNLEAFGSTLVHLILPSITLGVAVAATLVRVLRSGLIEVKKDEFVDALRARGLSKPAIVRHMLRNALPPTVIMMGIKIGSLLGGAIVIEVIFSWPGLGRLIVEAIRARDYPLVQGGVIVMAVLFVIVNLLTDLLHGFLDPRIRQAQKAGR